MEGERAVSGGNADPVRSAMSRVTLGEVRNVCVMQQRETADGRRDVVTAHGIAIRSYLTVNKMLPLRRPYR